MAQNLKIFYTEVFPQYFKKVNTKSFLFSEKFANIDISVWHLPPRYSISKWYSSHSNSFIRASYSSMIKLLTVKAELFCGSEFWRFFTWDERVTLPSKILELMKVKVLWGLMFATTESVIQLMHVNEIVPIIMYWQDDKRGPTNVKK